MATSSRNYYKNPFTLEVDTVSLFGELVIGAAGAVAAKKGGGIKAIVKQATAGQYEIELTDKFARILSIKVIPVGSIATLIGQVQVLENPSLLQADIKADGKIKIQFLDFSGAAVNAASGSSVMIEIVMRQSKIGRYDA